MKQRKQYLNTQDYYIQACFDGLTDHRLRRARRSVVCWAGRFDLHYSAWGALVLFGRWTLSNWFVAQTPRSISILIPFKRRDSELFNNMNIMPIYSIGQEQESNRNFRHFRFEFPSTFHLNFRPRFWRMEREDSLLVTFLFIISLLCDERASWIEPPKAEVETRAAEAGSR